MKRIYLLILAAIASLLIATPALASGDKIFETDNFPEGSTVSAVGLGNLQSGDVILVMQATFSSPAEAKAYAMNFQTGPDAVQPFEKDSPLLRNVDSGFYFASEGGSGWEGDIVGVLTLKGKTVTVVAETGDGLFDRGSDSDLIATLTLTAVRKGIADVEDVPLPSGWIVVTSMYNEKGGR